MEVNSLRDLHGEDSHARAMQRAEPVMRSALPAPALPCPTAPTPSRSPQLPLRAARWGGPRAQAAAGAPLQTGPAPQRHRDSPVPPPLLTMASVISKTSAPAAW